MKTFYGICISAVLAVAPAGAWAADYGTTTYCTAIYELMASDIHEMMSENIENAEEQREKAFVLDRTIAAARRAKALALDLGAAAGHNAKSVKEQIDKHYKKAIMELLLPEQVWREMNQCDDKLGFPRTMG